MPDSSSTLQESIARQREVLKTLLRDPLAQPAQACSLVWGDRERLNDALSQILAQQPVSKYMYALDTHAIQLSDTISRDGPTANDFGRNRADRPYMNERVPSEGFLLSQAYISLRAKGGLLDVTSLSALEWFFERLNQLHRPDSMALSSMRVKPASCHPMRLHIR